MKVIITCDPENIATAYDVLTEQLKDDWRKRYDKPGWGWFFYKNNIRFFVRGAVNGLSIKQVS